MSLFQKSVINKYLKNLDDEKVSKAFENFQKFYGDKLRLHNIMQLKEENYQEGFLREIFVETLGYTINPDNDFNLTTEFKNLNDARKADGAILRDGKAIGVIELKSTKTKHLESIKEQAFSYKNNQPGCRYVITSNFQSLRFYIDDATEYEEFNLFKLADSVKTDGLTRQFKLFYLLLSKESIFSNLPEKLKQETKFHENDISAQLYTDYKRFKNKIFENLVKNNPQYDKILLFKKSQKLLDRFLFVFFAEDSGLIPPNAVSEIVEQWKQLKELDEYRPLYTRFQKLFAHLDKGHKYEKWGEIPAYNGGLFRNDELLDSTELIIEDEVLEKDSLTLSAYDFNTEVDVNILGHIFEHSLNEIENITAQLRGEEIDKKKTKRKKDGIFYTPKYITKYIVENTVGTLCKEKKEELDINNTLIDDSLFQQPGKQRNKNRRVNPSAVLSPTEHTFYNRRVNPSAGAKLNKKGIILFKNLNNYKKWLLTLKILDPACGSGAFLNATLDFLVTEHKQTDNLIAELTGDALGLFDTDKAILENNIYGVDINEESVEIAKLSMWLRTAQKGRPLSDLSGNIKCGNSLIDDPELAGDKAFDWHKEFPQIFKKKKKEAWHITFALHNSRYSTDADGLTRRFAGDSVDTPGFVARTYPELSDKEEIILAEELAKIADEYKLNILQVNICKDHVHALLVCEKDELTKLTGNWKGKTAYNYNRRVYPSVENKQAQYPDGTKQKLWAKSFDKRKIKDKQHLTNTINYIKNNRKKHGYSDATDGATDGTIDGATDGATDGLTRQLSKMTTTVKHAFRPEYKGGFDAIIGNPPYVVLSPKELSAYLYSKGNNNTYIAFVEKSTALLKKNKKIGFIIPNTWFSGDNFEISREGILNNFNLEQIIQLPYDIFNAFIDTSIVIIVNQERLEKTLYYKYDIRDTQSEININKLTEFPNKEWLRFKKIFLNNDLLKLGDKVWFSDKNIELGLISKINRGSLPPKINEKSQIQNEFYNIKWFDDQVFRYVIDKKTDTDVFVSYENLRENKNIEVYNSEKLIARQLMSRQFRMNITYLDITYAFKKNLYAIYHLDKNFYYLCIMSVLNSRLFSFIQVNFNTSLQRDDFPAFSLRDFKNFPIPNVSKEDQKPFIEKADQMLSLNKELQEKSQRFIKRIKSNLEVEKLSGKLQNFYNYDFKIFIAELKKQKIKLSLTQQDEWEDYFDTYKQEINQLQIQISQTDKEIDKMVYELYELTEEEILIVENSVN